MKRHFIVTIDVPDNVTATDVRNYIRAAVMGWSGALQPPGQNGEGYDPEEDGDPLWGIGDNATVKSVKQETVK